MIRIYDLSVGNWVRLSGGVDYQVKAIDAAFDRLTLIGNGEQRTESLYKVNPIVISKQILANNGWVTDETYARLKIDDNISFEYYYHEHRLRKWYNGVDEWNNHARTTEITFEAHCWYIHQLQNALRLAGVDIEINL